MNNRFKEPLYLTESEHRSLRLSLAEIEGPLKDQTTSLKTSSLKEDSSKAFQEDYLQTSAEVCSKFRRILENSVVITDENLERFDDSIVRIGKTVTLLFDDNTEKTINICGAYCKTASNNATYTSPLGKAIIWKKVGDEFAYEVWNDLFIWEIISIVKTKK